MLAIGKDGGNKAKRIKGKVLVCRVEYETKDGTNWKAIVLAYSMEEAIEHLRRNVQTFDRYISTGITGAVDSVDEEVLKDIFASRPTVVEVIRETIKEDSSDDSEDKQLTCPWCDKTFISKITLGSHIKRFHMEGK